MTAQDGVFEKVEIQALGLSDEERERYAAIVQEAVLRAEAALLADDDDAEFRLAAVQADFALRPNESDADATYRLAKQILAQVRRAAPAGRQAPNRPEAAAPEPSEPEVTEEREVEAREEPVPAHAPVRAREEPVVEDVVTKEPEAQRPASLRREPIVLTRPEPVADELRVEAAVVERAEPSPPEPEQPPVRQQPARGMGSALSTPSMLRQAAEQDVREPEAEASEAVAVEEPVVTEGDASDSTA